jgi:hypothetical protein
MEGGAKEESVRLSVLAYASVCRPETRALEMRRWAKRRSWLRMMTWGETVSMRGLCSHRLGVVTVVGWHQYRGGARFA